ncbi:hypothetical protein KIPB_008992, partial [Kipferlia bialata]
EWPRVFEATLKDITEVPPVPSQYDVLSACVRVGIVDMHDKKCIPLSNVVEMPYKVSDTSPCTYTPVWDALGPNQKRGLLGKVPHTMPGDACLLWEFCLRLSVQPSGRDRKERKRSRGRGRDEDGGVRGDMSKWSTELAFSFGVIKLGGGVKEEDEGEDGEARGESDHSRADASDRSEASRSRSASPSERSDSRSRSRSRSRGRGSRSKGRRGKTKRPSVDFKQGERVSFSKVMEESPTLELLPVPPGALIRPSTAGPTPSMAPARHFARPSLRVPLFGGHASAAVQVHSGLEGEQQSMLKYEASILQKMRKAVTFTNKPCLQVAFSRVSQGRAHRLASLPSPYALLPPGTVRGLSVMQGILSTSVPRVLNPDGRYAVGMSLGSGLRVAPGMRTAMEALDMARPEPPYRRVKHALTPECRPAPFGALCNAYNTAYTQAPTEAKHDPGLFNKTAGSCAPHVHAHGGKDLDSQLRDDEWNLKRTCKPFSVRSICLTVDDFAGESSVGF